MKEKIKERCDKYFKLTEKALGKIEILSKLKEKDRKIAEDFLDMCSRYLSDAKHFYEKGDYILALGAVSYAHAWLDAGVRAGLLDGKGDDKLFTLK